MANLNVMREGTLVSITDGIYKGLTGVIHSWHDHDPLTYAVNLVDPAKPWKGKPHTHDAEKEVIIPNTGQTAIVKESVTVNRVEVAPEHLTELT